MTKPSGFLAVASVLVAWHASSASGDLVDASYYVRVNAGLPPSLLSALGHEAYIGGVPASLDSDYTGQYFGNSYSIQTQAQTFGAIPSQSVSPQAIVAVEVQGSGQMFYGEANAMVAYEVAVVRTRPDAPDVFVPFRIVGTNFVSGRGTAQLYVNDLLYDSVSILSGYQEHTFSLQAGAYPGSPLPIRITANATAQAGLATGYPSSSQAGADPLFAFDQVEFDQIMGPDTFPLANYFMFEYSPGLVTVPEPAAVAGLVGCLFLLRRRPRSSKSNRLGR